MKEKKLKKTSFFKDHANDIIQLVDKYDGLTFMSPCNNYIAVDIRKYDIVRRSTAVIEHLMRKKNVDK